MRLRNVKGSDKKVSEHSRIIEDEKDYKGKWNEKFGNNNPIHIEIGMGKGKFITTLAKNNPNINYIGFEKFTKVLVRALDNLDDEELDNVYAIRMDIEQILDVFEEGEIERIYLNFSDPWPKDRHAKRRLTHHDFLERYEKVLASNGRICFKTDNKHLFEFSLEEIEKHDWKTEKVTRDLHNSSYVEGNTMTEYEEKFVSLGMPIYRLEAFKVKI
ncbi:tRNA (guanosine(46)-N7)-methyltransferase TrmB [Vallitalea sp.]|jgi:tRNA (guanine-N7-)-methyltransferase|uniref:tRNA (guanosine(46)-N7)-methyltransferase TrmB n=1 Tax=Vallitalea sp. TaxID=1882829 RepID=UPI0025D1CA05|nr:tRNA (guanosine(46)-N7)-methyltransferase TrmB [Vallitalea sp.]MCT4686187.1 tRNA (guanosine(46)-N7)-methyltransferase TrmB [Vallitalea sp.]